MIPASETDPARQASVSFGGQPRQVLTSADSASATVRYPSEPGIALKVWCWLSILGVAEGWIEKKAFQNGYILHSILLVCPRCHKAWAKILIDGDWEAWPVATSCYPCNWQGNDPGGTHVPGSVLRSTSTNELTDWTLLEALPIELLKRELELHLKALDP
jgi:hypothetical protein